MIKSYCDLIQEWEHRLLVHRPQSFGSYRQFLLFPFNKFLRLSGCLDNSLRAISTSRMRLTARFDDDTCGSHRHMPVRRCLIH